jgi:hypothetical protein
MPVLNDQMKGRLAAAQAYFEATSTDQRAWADLTDQDQREYFAITSPLIAAYLAEQRREMGFRFDEDGRALIGHYNTPIENLRTRCSAWHFNKELLTASEQDILYVAEQLLNELDALAGGFLH